MLRTPTYYYCPRCDVCRSFKRMNPWKTPRPDGRPGQTLKVHVDNLAHTDAATTPSSSLLMTSSASSQSKSLALKLWWRETAALGSSGFM